MTRTTRPSLLAKATFFTALLVAPAAAQLPYQVGDINTGIAYLTPPPQPIYASLAEWIYHRGLDAAGGVELFRTHRATGAVEQVLDLLPGRGDTQCASMAVAGGRLFFLADDGEHGLELWTSDGTLPGTGMVRDIRPGRIGSSVLRQWRPEPLVTLGGEAYFSANDGSGVQLWVSDGTASGTQPVTAFPSTIRARFDEITVFAGAVHFSASSGNPPFAGQLWRVDRPSLTSQPIRTFATGPYCLTPMNGRLFFCSAGANAGYELWSSDGTTNGTDIVLDIQAGTGSSYPGSLTAAGGLLFFQADSGTTGHELWVSDGTTAGTRMVRDLNPTTGALEIDYRSEFVPFGAGVLVAADDGSTGRELWFSDGNLMVQVADIFPGPGSSLAENALEETGVIGNRVFFPADDGSTGTEPWFVDANGSGATRLADVTPGPVGSQPRRFLDAGNSIVAMATNNALVAFNGTVVTASTSNHRGIPRATADSDARNLLPLGDSVFFAAKDSLSGMELWSSDGSSVERVRDLAAGPASGFSTGDPQYNMDTGMFAAELEDHFLFPAYDSSGTLNVWRSNGTQVGTAPVVPFPRSTYGYNPPWGLTACRLRSRSYFGAPGGVWATNPTGANRVFTIAGIPRLFRFGSRLVAFSRATSFGPKELYLSDGTAAGTRHLRTFVDVPLGYPRDEVIVLGDTLLFVANDGASGSELWALDTGSNVPRLVRDIRTGAGSNPSGLTRVGDRIVFLADNGVIGRELWATDGTATGTQPLGELVPGPGDAGPETLEALGNQIIVAARGASGEATLWRFDPTSAAATLLSSLPDTNSSYDPYFENMIPVGTRRLAFLGSDAGEIGLEAWVTDGTAAGTGPLGDVAPAGWSGARDLVVSGGRLFWSAYDSPSNQELWAFELGAVAQPVGRGCARSGFPPRLTITDPVLGTPTTLNVTEAVPSALGYLAFGAPLPTPLRLPSDCVVHVDLNGAYLLPFLTSGNGDYSLSMPAPNSTALMNLDWMAQAVVLSSSADLTNGIRLDFGR